MERFLKLGWNYGLKFKDKHFWPPGQLQTISLQFPVNHSGDKNIMWRWGVPQNIDLCLLLMALGHH